MPYALSDYTTQVQRLVHDLNFVDFTQQELTDYINEARDRVALDFHCVRGLQTNLQTIASTEIYPITGGTGGVILTDGGAGYVSPIVTITGGGATSEATATATQTNGVVNAPTMTSWGAGYTSAPTVTIADSAGPGAGAAATAVTTTDAFDIGSVSVIWGSQRWTLSWLPWIAFQAFCRANITQYRYPGVWTTIPEQNSLYFYPIPDQMYGMEIDYRYLPDPLVSTTDVDTQILLPVAEGVKYYAAYLALLKLQNFQQADYYEKKYERRVPQLQATRQSARTQNVYKNYGRRLAGA